VEAFLRELTAEAIDAEASLRITAGGAVRGGRMMLERAGADVARRVGRELGIPWVDGATAVVDACEALDLPLIAGWDVGGAALKYKLYANASDASEAKCAALVGRLGLSSGLPRPTLVGINVASGAVETKLYVQRSKLVELDLDVEVPDVFAQIEAAAWVASYDVGGDDVTLRAVFAATVHGREGTAEAALSSLVGVRWSALEDSFPFAPGPLRQIGWADNGDVTVYAKRHGRAAPVFALAPLAVFRRGDVEVGLYVTPTDGAPRAFVRTDGHALTFRSRDGSPDAATLEALGAWAARQVAAGEGKGAVEATKFDAPPAGWRLVVPQAPSELG